MKTIIRLFSWIVGLFAITPTNAYGIDPVTGNMTTVYQTLMNINKPNVRNQIYHADGRQGADFLMTIMSLGYEGTIENKKHTVYAESGTRRPFKVLANVAGGATTITLGIATSEVDAQNRYYPQIGMTATFDNGVVGEITSIGGTAGAPTFTFTSMTGNFPSVVANQTLMLGSSSFREFSRQPDSIITKWETFDYYMKISKKTYAASNSAIAEKTYFDNGVSYVEDKGARDAEFELMKDISVACLTDTPITNATVITAQGNSGQVQGLYPYVTAGGGTQFYTPGFMNSGTFESAISYFNTKFAPREFIGFHGSAFMLELENVMALQMGLANNSAHFTKDVDTIRTKTGVKTGKELDFSFVSLKKGGYNFKFVENRELNDPTTFNLAGSNYKYINSCIFIPNGTIKTKNPTGQVTESPFMQLLFLNNNGQNRKMVMQKLSGMRSDEKSVTDLDGTFYHALSEYMTVFVGKEKFYGIFAN
jgi:hypothetical protein